MKQLIAVVSAFALIALSIPIASTAPAIVQFRVFARTGIRLTDVLWTGRQFLYVDNTTNRIVAAPPSGMPVRAFAAMPRQVEETRCAVSPGNHGFVEGDVYCHAPDNKIYRITSDGTHVDLFAVLPHVARSDGALAFDTSGSFGFALIAATGRSGGPTPKGGKVFAIDSHGTAHLIGSYSDQGGADEAAIAPADFGTASGEILLAVDAGKSGSIVAMDAHGKTHTLVTLPDGPNPIVSLQPGRAGSAGAAEPGVYVTDTLSRNVFFAPATALHPWLGKVLVGSELRGYFWAIAPTRTGYSATPIPTNLSAKSYNLEGATFVAG